MLVQKPLYPEGDAVCHTIVVHPPGGIAGGDELILEVAAGDKAHALLTTPGAAKWYRSSGAWARQRVSLEAAGSGVIEWLPQETIIFDGALADIGFEARLGAGAALLAWDIVCLGRRGSGERFTRGRCRIAARIVREGKPVLVERGMIEPGAPIVDAAPGLGGHSAFGTFIAASPSLSDELLARCREIQPREGESAATRLPGMIVARYRGDSGAAAREYFVALWRLLRTGVTGREAVEPRIWST